MKKYLFNLIIVLFLFSQCGKNEKTEKVESKPNNESNQNQDGYILKFKYNPGDKFEYNLLSIAEVNQGDGKINQSNKMTLTSRISGELITRDSAEFNFKMNFKSVKINAEITDPQGKMQNASFNSDDPVDSSKLNPAFLQYSAMVGNDFSARVGNNGEVLEIYRIDNIIKKLLGPNINKINDAQKNQLQVQFQNQIKTTIQQIFQYLPGKPVKVDSAWIRSGDDRIGPMNVRYLARYSLSGITKSENNDVAIIKAKLSSEISGNRKAEENGIKYSFDDLSTYGEGNIEFDINRGIVKKKEMEQGRNQTTTMSKEGKTMKIISKEKNKVTIELVK